MINCDWCKYQTKDETCGAFVCDGLDCPSLPCEINPKECIKENKEVNNFNG